MRKIKVGVSYRVPSWNFCTKDGGTADQRFSKELCRFCVKTKTGYRCVLYDCPLTTDPHFVYKTKDCISATAGNATTIEEPQVMTVDPQIIIAETIKQYDRLVNDLLKQNYPRSMAENIAKQVLSKGS